jgi:hypothetical protein
MVNEISAVGLTPAQGLDYTAGAVSKSSTPNATQRSVDMARDAIMRVTTSDTRFSELVGRKEELNQSARDVRAANQTLDQADEILQKIEQQVTMVKNYPPFPPGNEDRMNYIQGLTSLRKQMEAMAIPPVDDGYQPVLYPRDGGFPYLDPVSATDNEVTAFGQAASTMRGNVDAGVVELRRQSDAILARANVVDMNFAMSDSQAAAAGDAVVQGIERGSAALLSDARTLGQLGD